PTPGAPGKGTLAALGAARPRPGSLLGVVGFLRATAHGGRAPCGPALRRVAAPRRRRRRPRGASGGGPGTGGGPGGPRPAAGARPGGRLPGGGHGPPNTPAAGAAQGHAGTGWNMAFILPSRRAPPDGVAPGQQWRKRAG